MTIRAWMMSVVIAAALITAGQIGNRWRNFRALAAWHSKQADSLGKTAAAPRPAIGSIILGTDDSEALRQIEETKTLWRYDFGNHRRQYKHDVITVQQVAQTELELKNAQAELEQIVTQRRRLSHYHRAMSRKYQRAAARPWQLVEPGLPEP
jgi:hypothetical protein